jgi:hypothetical protein
MGDCHCVLGVRYFLVSLIDPPQGDQSDQVAQASAERTRQGATGVRVRTALVSPEATQRRREFARAVTAAFFPLENTFDVAWSGNIPDMPVVLVREMPSQKLITRIEQIGA